MSSVVNRRRPARLAIVGASVRAATQSALRAGFEVVGADLFADSDLDGICSITRIESYPDGLADWLAKQEVDAWMYTGALENYPDLVDRMARIAPLWGVSGKALRRCRDPLELQRVVHDAGLAFPETRRWKDARPAEGQWLCKTYRHSGGIGVRSLGLDGPPEGLGDGYLQRFVPGKPLAAMYVVSEARSVLLGVTEQLLSGQPDDWGYVGSIGPKQHEQPMLDRLGDCLRDALSLRGLVGVDLVAADDEATVIELNPRFTASTEVLERACGRSAVDSLSNAFVDRPIANWQPVGNRYCAKWVLFARRDVRVTPEFARGDFADRPQVGEVIAQGRPVCTLLVEGNSEAATLVSLRTAIDKAEQLLYGNTNDRVRLTTK
ncbi:MAG: ATP-grasp domain-containing protein [Planctomycetota bacterium]